MTKRVMQLQVLNGDARSFAAAAGRRNHWAAELARNQRERNHSPLAHAYRRPVPVRPGPRTSASPE